MPASFKLASENQVDFKSGFDRNYDRLSDKEIFVVEALEIQMVLSLMDVFELLDQKTVYPIVKSLLEKKAVLIEEELEERYQLKIDSFVKLSAEYSNEEKLQIAFDELQRAPKQLELLMRYVELSNLFGNSKREVRKVNLQKSSNANSSQVNQLKARIHCKFIRKK